VNLPVTRKGALDPSQRSGEMDLPVEKERPQNWFWKIETFEFRISKLATFRS
jgi:hypothetical protein